MKSVIATKDGFYDGKRVRKGQTFKVKDEAKGKWFVAPKDYVAPKERPLLQEVMNTSRRQEESFVTRMQQLAVGSIGDEKTPETMSEINDKMPKLPEVKRP